MKKKKPKPVAEAAKILNIPECDLELALEMLDALKRKIESWEDFKSES